MGSERTTKHLRDIKDFVIQSDLHSPVCLVASGKTYHEAEDLEEKNPAARKASAGRPGKAGQAETEPGGDGGRKESGRSVRRGRQRKEIRPTGNTSRSRAGSGSAGKGARTKNPQKSEEETQSFTGTTCATGGGNDGPVGGQESRRCDESATRCGHSRSCIGSNPGAGNRARERLSGFLPKRERKLYRLEAKLARMG